MDIDFDKTTLECEVIGDLDPDGYFIVERVLTYYNDIQYEVTLLVLFKAQDKINEHKLWIK